MRLLWQLHHIFMVSISSKCTDLSGPFTWGGGFAAVVSAQLTVLIA